jgi:hypothetical protein
MLRVRIRPISSPTPGQSFHRFVFVFSRPHNIALVNCADTESCCDEPQNDQHDCQSARNTIDRRAFQRTTRLNCGKRKPGVRKNECPPIQRELHLLGHYPRDYRNGGNEEEPVREKYDEQSSHDAHDFYNLAIRNNRVGEIIRWYESRRLLCEREKSCGSISCKLSVC